MEILRELLEGPLTPRPSGGFEFLWPEELDKATWREVRVVDQLPMSEAGKVRLA